MAQESNLIRNIVIAVVVGLMAVVFISMLTGSPEEEKRAARAPSPRSAEGPSTSPARERVSPSAPQAARPQAAPSPDASPEPARSPRPAATSAGMDSDAGRALSRAGRETPPVVEDPRDDAGDDYSDYGGDPDYIDPRSLVPSGEIPPELAALATAPKPEIPEALRVSLDEPHETPPELLRAIEDARYLETPPEIQDALDNAKYLETPPELLDAGTGR